LRIITGFIEPHFFAGFSGGVKGIMPGCAGLETVMSNHGAKNIGDPQATFGVTVGNPLWEELRDIALKTGPTFLLNVTLNEQRDITNVFAGDIITAAISHLAHSTPTELLFSSTDFNSYVTVSIADGAPQRDNGRLAAAITPGLGITPKTEALGQAMFEAG
jgi:hypothetical protein